MALKGSPAPHWTNKPGTAADARRLSPYLDPSGFWVPRDDKAASGAFVDDPGGSGFTVIDDTVTTGLKPTLLPNNFIITY